MQKAHDVFISTIIFIILYAPKYDYFPPLSWMLAPKYYAPHYAGINHLTLRLLIRKHRVLKRPATRFPLLVINIAGLDADYVQTIPMV